MKVAKESANKSINAAERKADWWLYGGLYRPVWLEVLPQVHVGHFTLNADDEGRLNVALEMEGDASGYELVTSLTALKDGRVMTDLSGRTEVSHVIENGEREQLFTSQWGSVRIW